MRVQKVGARGFLFTFTVPHEEWDLNLHLIRGERCDYIIDTGLGSLSIAPMEEYLQYDKPAIVVNTHYHWDHVWGNGSLRHCTIVSHRLCREMIQSHWQDMMEKNHRYHHGEVEMVLPSLVFERELYFPEDQVRLVYTPGHTIDSISVLDEADKVLNAGDNIGDTPEEIVPSIDTDKDLYVDSLHRYLDLDFDTCVSGHNVVLGRDVIHRLLAILQRTPRP
ncbi:MAG: MBL fold metallo-hydrolase [Bacillota bacterium]